MNKIYSFLFIFSFVMLTGCSSEPKTNIKDSSGTLVENRGPIYKTSACNDSDKELLRQCGDIKLVETLEQAILEALGDDETPASSKLVIVFDVLTSGKPDNITIKRGISEVLDQVAVDIIKKSRWEPAVHDGKEQKIQRRIPLVFDF